MQYCFYNAHFSVAYFFCESLYYDQSEGTIMELGGQIVPKPGLFKAKLALIEDLRP